MTALPFLPIIYFWAKAAYDESLKPDSSPFYYSQPFWLILAFVIGTYVWAFIRMTQSSRGRTKNSWLDLPIRFRLALSQTLLIGSKQFEDQKLTQHIRETDPNDFEFQQTLRSILACVQTERDRVVIVLDNIDRLPTKEINDYWAQVRAVFSNGPVRTNTDPRSAVTAIVPYDRHLVDGTNVLNELLPKKLDQPAGGDPEDTRKAAPISPLGSRELFAKTFDEVLQVSPPVMSNSRDFFIDKMGVALPSAKGGDELYRVYLIFDRILRHENGNVTPRQIISFINELSGMYVLHRGLFALPTVAVYLAYRDVLEAKPDVLNDPQSMDPRIRALAEDPELEQNLAAMIFNVEPELALQLLLDKKIKDAAVGPLEGLITLGKGPAFDLRVEAVVQDSVREWVQSGEMPKVVSNFAGLPPDCLRNAAALVYRHLISAIKESRTISLERKSYQDLFECFEFALPTEREAVATAIVSSGFNQLSTKSGFRINGEAWVQFISDLAERLARYGDRHLIENALGSIDFPAAPGFLLEVASAVGVHGLSLHQFGPRKADFIDDDPTYSEVAIQQPSKARAAFREFKAINLLPEAKWVSIANELVKQLITEETIEPETFLGQLDILADVCTYVRAAGRDEIALLEMFTSSFYNNLYSSAQKEAGDSLGSAVFLALLQFGAAGPSAPVKRTPNGRTVDNSDEYLWFSSLFSADRTPHERVRRVSYLSKQAGMITRLTDELEANPAQPLLKDIIRSAFVDDGLPTTNLPYLIKRYELLGEVLGSQTMALLERYHERVSDADIGNIDLETFPAELLMDIQQASADRWKAVVERLEQLLRAVPIADWAKHLSDHTNQSRILLQMIRGSEFQFVDPSFRDVFVETVLGTLSGTFTLASPSSHDALFAAIEKNYHAAVLRQLREKISDVKATNLSFATGVFPETIRHIVILHESLTKAQKENLVRFLLCPALEGSNNTVLDAFSTLGSPKVRDLLKNSEESTQLMVKGAIGVYSRANGEQATAQISELIYGKKRSRSMWDFWFGTREDNEDEVA
jgi:hypothetical protein